MKRLITSNILDHFVCFFVYAVLVLFPFNAAWAQIEIYDAQPTDVTSSGFAVVWQTSEAATPRIEIFSDPLGTLNITSNFEITSIPLYGGNPDAINEYYNQEKLDDLRDLADSLGMMKVGVQGCLPSTTYYYRIFSESGGDLVFWPASGLASLTTMEENGFVFDSRQLLVTLVNDTGTLDPEGWMMTASVSETFYPISSYVADGTDTNQAYLDLSNLFDADHDNWTPAELQVVTLEVRQPGSASIQRGLTLFYTGEFHVSLLGNVEINIDQPGDSDAPDIQVFPAPGLYDLAQNVTLSTDEPAYIFYTTDGSEPTVLSTLYADAILINATTTLKYLAVDMAGNQSAVYSVFYSIVYNIPPLVPVATDPVNGATGISIKTALTWQGGDPDPADVVTYDVYMGISDTDMLEICVAQTAVSCQPPLLQFSTAYYWQVIAKDNRDGETSSTIWHFTSFAYDGDEDGDELSNEDELTAGTDPHDPDSDKDGYGDGDEIGFGSNPLDDTSKPPYPPMYGDINGDNTIDDVDQALLMSAYGSIAGDENYLAAADFNKDGSVDDLDLEMFSRVLGYVFSPAYDSAADFDDDGDMDGRDVTLLIVKLGLAAADPDHNSRFDLNADGLINRWDMALFAMNYGSQAE